MARLKGLALALVALLAMVSGAAAQADGSFWWLNNNGGSNAADAAADNTDDAAGDLTAADEDVFCECVEYYLCVDGVINTSGVGVLDIRSGLPRPPPVTNVESCPGKYQVCCRLPGLEETTTTTTTTTTTPRPTLPPDTPCECVSFLNCPLEKMVHNGGLNLTLNLPGLEGYSHSQCPDLMAVCCALDPTTAAPTPAPFPPMPGVDLHGAALNGGDPEPSTPSCECVDPHQCGEDGHIITNGLGILDIRTHVRRPPPSAEGDACEDPMQVCCLPPPEEEETPVHSLSTSRPYNATTTSTTTTTTPEPTTTSEPPIACGTRNSNGVRARIMGFSEGESQFGEFPWVATIVRREELLGKVHHLFVGGATLVHKQVIVTAAHKVAHLDASELVVRLGEWDAQSTLEAYPHQDLLVESVLVHPRYSPKTLFHDVAILFLKEEAAVAPHIGPICLAKGWDEVDKDACVINGWGKDALDKGKYQVIMKSLVLPLVESNKCQAALRRTRLGRYYRLHSSFICAGGEKGKDACTGDGGGPLACPRIDDPTRYLLMGITAWGIGCGKDGLPGVYVNIPEHYDWVMDAIEEKFPATTTTQSTTTTTTEATTTTEEVQDYFEQGDSEIDYDLWEEDRRKKKKGKKQNRRERRTERRNRRQERREYRRMNEE